LAEEIATLVMKKIGLRDREESYSLKTDL
jgi:hypothetical protein